MQFHTGFNESTLKIESIVVSSEYAAINNFVSFLDQRGFVFSEQIWSVERTKEQNYMQRTFDESAKIVKWVASVEKNHIQSAFTCNHIPEQIHRRLS